MGLLDSLVTSAVSSALGGNAETLTGNLVKSVVNMATNNAGGLSGLVEKFNQSGLGDIAKSWVDKGDNKPISADQVVEALGQDKVDELAKDAGIPKEKGAEVLSQVLPNVVNEMTPDGKVPEKHEWGALSKVILGGLGVAGATMAAKAVAGRMHRDDGTPVEDDSELADAGNAAQAAASQSALAAAPAASGQTYTVVSGDSLSKIAKHFYGNPNDWHKIFDANRDQISNPDLIQPGQVLRIP